MYISRLTLYEHLIPFLPRTADVWTQVLQIMRLQALFLLTSQRRIQSHAIVTGSQGSEDTEVAVLTHDTDLKPKVVVLART